MTKTVKILSVLLGVLMFLPGLKKLFEASKTKFYLQIELSELPFTDFTYWLGITGEITVGLALLALVVVQIRLKPLTRDGVFYTLHFVTLFDTSRRILHAPSSKCARGVLAIGEAANFPNPIDFAALYQPVPLPKERAESRRILKEMP